MDIEDELGYRKSYEVLFLEKIKRVLQEELILNLFLIYTVYLAFMEIYLAQHGEAMLEEEDKRRPLSDKGKWELVQVAGRLAKAQVKVDMIAHSGKLRAKMTAEIYANHLRPSSGVTEIIGISPNDPISAAEALIKGAKAPLMIVGHLPHLSKLSSYLLCGDEGADVLSFRMGSVACLDYSDKWKLKWYLVPELL